MMLKGFVLVGGVLLAAMPVSLLAQVGGCSACETAIRDKLTELDDRTGKTNLLVKTVDRKLDPLVVKVDTLDNKLTVLEEKIDAVGTQILQLSNSGASKGAVVIEFGAGVSGPSHNPPFGTNNYKPQDEMATEYCLTIGYRAGRALAKQDISYGTNPAGLPILASRTILKLVCFN